MFTCVKGLYKALGRPHPPPTPPHPLLNALSGKRHLIRTMNARTPANPSARICPLNKRLPKVLEVFSELFIHIFDELNRHCKEELEAVRQQHPFKDLRYTRPTLRLTFQEGIQLLRDAGYDGEPCRRCCFVVVGVGEDVGFVAGEGFGFVIGVGAVGTYLVCI